MNTHKGTGEQINCSEPLFFFAALLSTVGDGIGMLWFPRNQGSTALLWASTGGSLEVVEWLVKQAGVNVGHRNKVRGGDAMAAGREQF